MGIGAAIAGAGALSAGASIFGSSAAASAQENAASQATAAQLQMFQTLQKDLTPYMNAGNSSEAAFMQMLGLTPGGNMSSLPGGVSLSSVLNPTNATLENLPGYQFELAQGLQATQNGFSAQGLGTSGAAIKGAGNYAQGLASSDWQAYINSALSQRQNIAQNLLAPTQLGEAAAAQTASGALSTGASIGSNIIGGGNAAAGSILAGTSAITNQLNPLSIAFLSQMMNNSGPGNSGFTNGISPSGALSFGSPGAG